MSLRFKYRLRSFRAGSKKTHQPPGPREPLNPLPHPGRPQRALPGGTAPVLRGVARRAWRVVRGARRWEGRGVLSPGGWAVPAANSPQAVRCADLREIRLRPQQVALSAVREDALSRLQRESGCPGPAGPRCASGSRAWGRSGVLWVWRDRPWYSEGRGRRKGLSSGILGAVVSQSLPAGCFQG